MQNISDSSKDKQYQRKISAVIPKRNWIQRNPRFFQIAVITSSLLVFFSRPLYDIFFAEELPPPPPGTKLKRFGNI